MRFIIIAGAEAAYDVRMAYDFGAALAMFGHQVKMALPSARTAQNLGGEDVVIDINRARPEFLSKDTIHIAWVQDVVPADTSDYAAAARNDDMIYALGDHELIGLPDCGKFARGSLLTGVRADLLTKPAIAPAIDLSLCGFISEPISQERDESPRFEIDRALRDEVEKHFVPLTGSLRVGEMMQLMTVRFRAAMHGKFKDADLMLAYNEIPAVIGGIARDHPRRIDRTLLAQLMLAVSKNVLFMGFNWHRHSQFFPFYKPHTNDETALHDVYQSSRINVHSNILGFGLHSRVLEAMALGGFIMTHESVEPKRAGRITECFEPNVHFGSFTADNFVERAKYWLADEARRSKAICEARRIVAAKHTWKCRAWQILCDLGLKAMAA